MPFYSQLGATDRLIALFQRATSVYEEAINQRSSILSNSSELSYIEGVRLEDLVELLLVALQSMAQHSIARIALVQAPEGVFGSFVQVESRDALITSRSCLSVDELASSSPLVPLQQFGIPSRRFTQSAK